MEKDCEKKPIVIKHQFLDGVDHSLIDLGYAHSTPVLWTKVIKTLSTRNGITTVGLKQLLLSQEIVQMGNFKILYKIIGNSKKTIPQGYIYRIKRVDGANITNYDIENIMLGDKIKIASRRSASQIFGEIYNILEQKPTQD